MPLGIVLVIFWLLVTVGAIVLAATYGMRWLQAWLSAPEEAPLPPPDRLGAECVVWQFADQFVETVPKNQVPEWKRHRYTELKDGKLALTQPLAETMLLAAMAELWRQGLLQFRLAPKTPDPFDPHSLDYEVLITLSDDVPLTPLGRSFRLGFQQAIKPVWLLRDARQEAVLEDFVEFALREVRRCLGWRRARRSSAENLVLYVAEFAQAHPATETDLVRLKETLAALHCHEPQLSQALKDALRYTLLALQRLEPSRDEWGL
ncbi:MAG: hypothetical protein RJAPGHWK_001386 [Candidatus Fervidibacter sp.]